MDCNSRLRMGRSPSTRWAWQRLDKASTITSELTWVLARKSRWARRVCKRTSALIRTTPTRKLAKAKRCPRPKRRIIEENGMLLDYNRIVDSSLGRNEYESKTYRDTQEP